MNGYVKKSVVKVIAFGLPMELHFEADDGVPELRGFWSLFYIYILAPIDDLLNNGEEYMFFEYEGCYLKALYHYLFHKGEV